MAELFPQMDDNSIRLERMKVAARTQLSPQMAHDLEVHVIEHVMDRLIVELRTNVYAHKLAEKEQVVPFSKTVRIPAAIVTLPRLWLPHALGGALCGALAIALGSILLGIASLAFVVLAAATRTPREIVIDSGDVTVSGDATISATYFNTFPDNTTVYPSSLGSPVRVVQFAAPDVRYYDELGRDAASDDPRGERDR